MSTKPEISIVVPCFNQGMYLEDLIISVNNSTSVGTEILIINDGSTEYSTLRKLDQLSTHNNSNIQVIHQSNQGLSSARNNGHSRSSGNYVKFLDADDLLLKGSLDRQYALIEESNSFDVVIDDFYYTDKFRSNYWRENPSTIENFVFSWADFFSCWESGLTIPIHAALFRKTSINNFTFHEGIRAKEDWIYWCTLAANGLVMKYSGEPGCVYRVHDSNMTKDIKKMTISWLNAFEINLRIAEEKEMAIDPEQIERLRRHFENFYSRQLSEVSESVKQTKLSKILELWG
jgi:glycosyltransferase involved in cell wall biosynthesis